MGLTEKEKEMLERLTAKSKEPDAPPIGRSLSVHIDMGDEKAIARAQRFGFLAPDEDDDGDGDGDGDGEETPKRRGYFPSN